MKEYSKSFIQVLYTSDFGHRWYFGERSFWNIPTVFSRKTSKDYRKTTTIYGISQLDLGIRLPKEGKLLNHFTIFNNSRIMIFLIITTCFDNRMKFKSGQTWTLKRKLTTMIYASYNCVITICYSSKSHTLENVLHYV